MQIAFLIYEGLTALDIIGPYEVLSQIPGADVRFVAKRSGSIAVDSGAFSIGTEHELADVPRPEVFVIPGGMAGTFAAIEVLTEFVIASTAHRISPWLKRVGRRFNQVCGGIFVAIGAALPLRG